MREKRFRRKNRAPEELQKDLLSLSLIVDSLYQGVRDLNYGENQSGQGGTVYLLSNGNQQRSLFYMRYLALKREIATLHNNPETDGSTTLTNEQQVFEKSEEYEQQRQAYQKELLSLVPEIITGYPNPTKGKVTIKVNSQTFMELHNSFREISWNSRNLQTDNPYISLGNDTSISEMEADFNPLHGLPVINGNDLKDISLEEVLNNPGDYGYGIPGSFSNLRVNFYQNTIYSPINESGHFRDITNGNSIGTGQMIAGVDTISENGGIAYFPNSVNRTPYRGSELPTYNLQTGNSVTPIQELTESFQKEYVPYVIGNAQIFSVNGKNITDFYGTSSFEVNGDGVSCNFYYPVSYWGSIEWRRNSYKICSSRLVC